MTEGESDDGSIFDQWVVRAAPLQVAAFYEAEMPKLGWVEVNNRLRDATDPTFVYQSKDGEWSATILLRVATMQGEGTEVKVYRKKLGN